MAFDRDGCLAVLEEARALLALPDNDFDWSSFRSRDAALKELDRHIARIRAGGRPSLWMRGLFAATGPIQEVSLSSGWADEFLELADRFDAVSGP